MQRDRVEVSQFMRVVFKLSICCVCNCALCIVHCAFISFGKMRLSKMPPSMLKVSRMTRVCQKGVPERRWTAHSIGRLCVMRHMSANIVISRRVSGSVAMMAIGAYRGRNSEEK